MAPCHELTKRFAFASAIARGRSQITEFRFKEAGDPLEQFESLLLHGGRHSIRITRCVTQW
jgi:hypothetical protein